MEELFILVDYETKKPIDFYICEKTSELEEAMSIAEEVACEQGECVYESFLKILDEKHIKYKQVNPAEYEY